MYWQVLSEAPQVLPTFILSFLSSLFLFLFGGQHWSGGGQISGTLLLRACSGEEGSYEVLSPIAPFHPIQSGLVSR